MRGHSVIVVNNVTPVTKVHYLHKATNTLSAEIRATLTEML